MKLTNFLREQGYDLIGGPVRNHKPLQLWEKKLWDEAQLSYYNINEAFKSDTLLNAFENPALSIDYTRKDDYGFNIGITLLDEILKSLGLGSFELSSRIKSGKTVSISYNNSMTQEYAVGHLETYFSSADFVHNNPVLLKHLNRNHLLIITGVLFAKTMVVNIETDFSVEANLLTSLNAAVDGKLVFTAGSHTTLKMVSTGNTFFPVAIKASRIDYDKGSFKKLKLITDTQNIF